MTVVQIPLQLEVSPPNLLFCKTWVNSLSTATISSPATTSLVYWFNSRVKFSEWNEFHHSRDKAVYPMPKQQSKCRLRSPLPAVTLAIKIKKVDLIRSNGLWLFQLLRQDPIPLPRFCSLGKDFLQYRHENTGVDETKTCIAHPSKPTTAGQTGSAKLPVPGRQRRFPADRNRLGTPFLKCPNLHKRTKVTETEEQWTSNQKDEETGSLWLKSLSEESCNDNTFPHLHPVITCQISPNHCPSNCTRPSGNDNHHLHLWVLLWEKGSLCPWNNLHGRTLSASLLDHFSHWTLCADTG